MAKKSDVLYVWQDRKRIIFGLPWTFTRYYLTEEKLIIKTGFLSINEEEVRLYRIMDMGLRRPLSQRMWGLGTIHIVSADKSTPEFDIKNIPNSEYVKNMLSDMVEAERVKKRVSGREFMSSEDDEDINL